VRPQVADRLDVVMPRKSPKRPQRRCRLPNGRHGRRRAWPIWKGSGRARVGRAVAGQPGIMDMLGRLVWATGGGMPAAAAIAGENGKNDVSKSGCGVGAENSTTGGVGAPSSLARGAPLVRKPAVSTGAKGARRHSGGRGGAEKSTAGGTDANATGRRTPLAKPRAAMTISSLSRRACGDGAIEAGGARAAMAEVSARVDAPPLGGRRPPLPRPSDMLVCELAKRPGGGDQHKNVLRKEPRSVRGLRSEDP